MRWHSTSMIAAALVVAGPASAQDMPDALSASAYDWPATTFPSVLPPVTRAPSAAFVVEEVTEGLTSPWGMAFLPDGRILVTERAGALRIVEADGTLRPEPVAGLPEISFRGGIWQGGLLDVTLDPAFAENRLVYLAYVVEEDGLEFTRVSRFRLEDDALTDMEVVLAGDASHAQQSKHFGARLEFAPDGTLFVSLGERGEGYRAQSYADIQGAILRVNADGSVPEDNPFAEETPPQLAPFVDVSQVRPEIFTIGNRNPQGLCVEPTTGALWGTEHGPSGNDRPGGGDEINLYEAGMNYGWPIVSHDEHLDHPSIRPPLAQYTPASAPTGCTFYTGDAFPEWQGDLFFATLRGGPTGDGPAIVRLDVEDGEIVAHEDLAKGAYGRLRDIEQGPDGALYFLTSDTDAYGPGRDGGDRLMRIVPERP